MKILEIEANIENLSEVYAAVDEELRTFECPRKSLFQIRTAIEEIFVNVASYAYQNESKPLTIECEAGGAPACLTVSFIDRGVPYDPLEKPDPDLELPAEERGIGGLGILMVKNIMDDVKYEYKDGKNILTIRKNLA